MDDYHIQQTLERTFGWKSDKLKSKVKKSDRNEGAKDVWVSNGYLLKCDGGREETRKMNCFRTYILNHWDVIQVCQKEQRMSPKMPGN